jgi:signal transduction histidine kinase
MNRRGHVVIAGCAAALAAAEWLYGTAPAWAWLAAGAGAATLALVLAPSARARQRPPAAPLVAGVMAAALGVTVLRAAETIRRIECCWPELRERLLTRASEALGTTLAGAVANARRLADRGAAVAPLQPGAAFTHLERALAEDDARHERGVLIHDPAGEPWAWAGRHRFLPRPDTAELAAAITPFYVTLEARRQTPEGRAAVGHVLLDAREEVPDRERALGVAFSQSHRVTLQFFAPGTAPQGTDVLDFCAGPCDPEEGSLLGADTLFSVQSRPPTQGDAKEAARRQAAGLASIALAALLVSLLVTAPAGTTRWTVLGVGCWTLVRAAAGVAIEPSLLFSPGAFFRPALGPFSASAGSLAALGAVVVAASAALWERGLRRRWWLVACAAVLALAAPYLLRYFGRGITPPASGVGFALWLSWQMALATTSLALVLLAAALVRAGEEPARVPWTLPAACVWAIGAAVAGLWLWRPAGGAWPDWYPFIWLPALAGVLVPAPRRWVLLGGATVAGTAAALLTWGAAVEGRLNLAQRDVQRLGREGDNVAVAFLERLGAQAALAPPPASPGQLYALWRRSPLAGGEYPTVLVLWSEGGELAADLRLAALDLPTRLLAELARSADRRAGVRVERLDRLPGVHYVLVAPLPAGGVLTVGVGPRSQLLPPHRVARFLRGEVGLEPLYTLTLSLPSTAAAVETRALAWSRRGWSARGDRHVAFPDGVRHVHARVDLGGPWALSARGALVVAADLALLALLWALGRFAALDWRPRLPLVVQLLRASFRARLAAVLATFFVLPVLAFAVWSFARLRDEARRDGDLLIRQTLRDAEATTGAVAFERPAVAGSTVADLGLRLDSELWLYREGVLEAVSSPVLAELGIVEHVLAPLVHRRLELEDELELAADARTAGRPVRVGYRVVRVDPLGRRAVLAAAQLLDDERVRREQEDLAIALTLATLGALVAAVMLAGAAARALSQPVAALREAALAVGRGAPPPPLQPGGPQEFESVFAAFDRMATDVRESHEALEAARRRTAQVLANVATGVVAVDGALRVTTANPRAEELLGASLPAGAALSAAAPASWAPVWEAVVAFLRRHPGAPEQIVEREFDIEGRQVRVQIAGLGAAGCVVALDDATELTRAARVLAWGEMARQVAHEIKNPLTPIRLGIQHLQRARRGADFEAALDETARRILEEIDRLDAIARAFSRFGAPAVEAPPLEPVDVLRTAGEVVQLYALGRSPGKQRDAGPRFEVQGEPGPPVRARQAELKEVLVNVLENARQAEARRVVVRVETDRLVVEDDGKGIPPEALPRVFEPTFSTTSSGSGLGLAIARRLVESWGGRIEIESRAGRGTSVVITFGPVAG